ncbi:restriction endonuclease subunit S [Campylobacter lari]|uniref:Restriction endonuclease subunit S n=1 Tax=Campylobacter lari TaxID=201 RepID=A0A698FVV0_CAMLA|nr:restriction endonuclease subunit S [Campylobacter lari]EAK0823662.1 restriction endonuclease subunit S [Campylobacter lari]ECW8955082.1 restriction endonuclease subunit S [Campylobacter lari]MBT0794697.1 restriction endonuclease subunit S [Campylobacter lari]
MKNFKDSGIEWLGEIPEHWEVVKINKIVTFVNGYAFENFDFNPTFEIPVIRIGDIQKEKILYDNCLKTKEKEKLKQFLISNNDILIALSGATTGKIAFCDTDNKAYINQRVAIVRSKLKLVKYYFLTRGFSLLIELACNGSAQPNISTKEIGEFKIPLPPLKEQEQITNFLDKKCEQIKNFIEKKEKLISLLKEQKQALINETITKGLDKNVNFKESGIEWLGEIPQHWEIRKLKYLATIYNGKDQSYITSDDGIFPIYGSGGIIGKTHQFLYDKQSVLLGRKGTIDKPLFVEIPFWTIDTMFYTKISCSTYPKYFYYLCLTIDFKTYISGSAIPSMTQSDLIEIIFPFAPLKEQEQIANFLDKKCEKIDLLIEKTEKQIKLIKEYKTTLINQAVCGRIKKS